MKVGSMRNRRNILCSKPNFSVAAVALSETLDKFI